MQDDFEENANNLSKLIVSQFNDNEERKETYNKRIESEQNNQSEDSQEISVPKIKFDGKLIQNEVIEEKKQSQEIQRNQQEHEEDEEEQEDEQEEYEEEKKPKKRHYSLKRQLEDIQRDKYRAIEEAKQNRDMLEQALREKEELRSYLTTAEQGYLVSKQENIQNRINSATNQKEEAIISGDVKGQTKAELELQLAIKELDRFNEMAARIPGFQYPGSQNVNNQQQYQPDPSNYSNGYPQQYQQGQQTYQEPRFHPDLSYNAKTWEDANPWYNKNSREYDHEFANSFEQAANQYNMELYKSGLVNQIGSAEYFHRIQDWIEKNRPTKNLSLKRPNRGYTAGGAGRSGSGESSIDPEMEKKHRGMAANLNIPYSKYYETYVKPYS